MSLKITAQEKQALYYTVKLEGSLDTSTYPQLESQLRALIVIPAKAIVLDMSKLDYISSMGLRVIFKALKDMQAQGGWLVLSSMQPQIHKVFEIANALPDDGIFETVEEADAYYDAMQKKVREAGKK
jgi:anti-anti-sigma factor